MASSWMAASVEIAGRSTNATVPSGLRAVLIAPRLEGARVYKGEVVATDCWPAILEPLTAAKVRLVLAGGRTTRRRRIDHDALLGDLVRCGSCDGNLRWYRSGGVARYRCVPDEDHCGAASIHADDLEQWVIAQTRRRLRHRGRGNGRGSTPTVDEAAVAAVLNTTSSALRAVNSAYFIDGDLTRSEWRRLRGDILDRHDIDVHNADPNWMPPGLPAGLAVTDIFKRWGNLSRAARRAAITGELRALHVTPAPRHLSHFHPSRVNADWYRPGPTPPVTTAPPPPNLWHWEQGQPRVPDHVPTAEVLRRLDRPLTLAEACRVTDVRPKTLYRAIDRDALHVEGTGTGRTVAVAVLDHWSATKRTVANSHGPRLSLQSVEHVAASLAMSGPLGQREGARRRLHHHNRG